MKLKIELIADPETKKYYKHIVEKVEKELGLAGKAKKTGFDASEEIECVPTTDLGDRAEKIVGPKGIAQHYRSALKENSGNRMNTIFQIFREIIEQKWFEIPDAEKRLEQAIKTGLVLVTEGVVISPLDGLPFVKISQNPDGSKYVDIYYAGPIRAAGGSATVVPLILGDYARKLLGLDRFKPTEDEIERYVEEITIYQEEIVSRQYTMSEKEIRAIIRGCPVCINGIPTEDREVSVHRDLKRFPSNRIRGGMGLVASEGIALKALKILQWAKMLGLDWSWLEEIVVVEKSSDKAAEIKPSSKYLERLAAGRPIFSYPLEHGGFRLRYGRSRNTGCMAKAINPATMYVLDEFIAVGTHIRIERPGKAAQLFPCDSIEGPTVLLKSGEAIRLNSSEEAQRHAKNIKKILYLGDLLITVGDFRKTAHPLVPAGYCEEWWALELEEAMLEKKKTGTDLEEIEFDAAEIDCFTAVELSMQLGIPLHPKFLFYYNALEKRELAELAKDARGAEKIFEENRIIEARIPLNEEKKELLERIGLPHKIVGEEIVVGKDFAYPFLKTVGALSAEDAAKKILSTPSIFEALSEISGIRIMDRAGTFIGVRMGRPEAARAREMKGNPHVLFPIGLNGGSTRSINKAAELGGIEVEIALYECPECGKQKFSSYCGECGSRTKIVRICTSCGRRTEKEFCERCHAQSAAFDRRLIDLGEALELALKNLDTRMPVIVKGVKGMISGSKIPEPLEKGILRAKHDVHVFRDGTSRFELLNAALTHFTPKEIGLSLEKAREFGYTKDCYGKELESEEQMLELKAQDLVVNEGCGEWLLKMSRFVDDLLVRFYKKDSYYNASKKEDLVGALVLGLAPHTSAAIVGRIIGYSKARLGWSHPYFLMTKRRNVDGDQDSVMLLMDALLNFSNTYLSAGRGGRMDAPLVFTVALNPEEIDDEVYDMETCCSYPLELYEKAQQHAMPFLESIQIIKKKLGKEGQYTGIGFTHCTKTFDLGPKQSMYTQLGSMEEKIRRQAVLQSKIRAVHLKDSIERVLASHFFPDIIGNARAFSRQTFRCTNCNARYRRIPLIGHCPACGGHIILTIAQGSVRKYLEIAKEMIRTYELSDYLSQRLRLVESEIDSVFISEKAEQKNLFEFV